MLRLGNTNGKEGDSILKSARLARLGTASFYAGVRHKRQSVQQD